MINKFLNFTQYYFTGIKHLRIGAHIIAFARLAPYFSLAIILTALGDIHNNIYIFFTGLIFILYFTFCFFFLKIFKSRVTNGLTRMK